jgi:hypothetical protein
VSRRNSGINYFIPSRNEIDEKGKIKGSAHQCRDKSGKVGDRLGVGRRRRGKR